MRISFLTHTDDPFRPISDITIPVFQEYCSRYGYDFHCKYEHSGHRHIVWEKIALIISLFENKREDFDWICYCDADVLIMNHTIRLESFIDDTKDLIASHDLNGFNAGVFFLKNSNWSFDFMRNVWNINPHNAKMEGKYNVTMAEQLAMKAVMSEMEVGQKRKHIKIVSQDLFNCYLYGLYSLTYKEGNYKEGDFILHLPGMENFRRVDVLNRYKGEIIR